MRKDISTILLALLGLLEAAAYEPLYANEPGRLLLRTASIKPKDYESYFYLIEGNRAEQEKALKYFWDRNEIRLLVACIPKMSMADGNLVLNKLIEVKDHDPIVVQALIALIKKHREELLAITNDNGEERITVRGRIQRIANILSKMTKIDPPDFSLRTPEQLDGFIVKVEKKVMELR